MTGMFYIHTYILNMLALGSINWHLHIKHVGGRGTASNYILNYFKAMCLIYFNILNYQIMNI